MVFGVEFRKTFLADVAMGSETSRKVVGGNVGRVLGRYVLYRG